MLSRNGQTRFPNDRPPDTPEAPDKTPPTPRPPDLAMDDPDEYSLDVVGKMLDSLLEKKEQAKKENSKKQP